MHVPPFPAGFPRERCDVLVVGAGPTGLALAAALHTFGASVRVVDKSLDRTSESRALVVQPRTLEVMRALGLADELVALGMPAVTLRLWMGKRVASVQLFDIGMDDTAFPFLLFVSQAQTEAVLSDYLAAQGVAVERGVELVSFDPGSDGILATLRRDGSEELQRASYLVGCDGGRSTVRSQAGIPFVGGDYPQSFLLADLEVDGLDPGTVNAFVTEHGPLFFFPLGRPASWRVVAMRPDTSGGDSVAAVVAELQASSDAATGGRLRLRDPVWATPFRLHHRQAARYRDGRVFLAGDAAHVHSPAGAQGMNTGIQDAWNLGWKLGLVCRGSAPEALLDSYDAERRPVGRFVLRFTDRAFRLAASGSPLARPLRSVVAPRALPVALRFRAGRAVAFRIVSQLGIRYRDSPAVSATARDSRTPRRAPRAGDRLPDAPVTWHGRRGRLHEALSAPSFHLLLCGGGNGAGPWDAAALDALRERHGALLTVSELSDRPDAALHDPDRVALSRLVVHGAACLVVRPDGHIGWRGDGNDLSGARDYLAQWLTRAGADRS